MKNTLRLAMTTLLCIILFIATCFAEETTEPLLESTSPIETDSETEEMILYPEALVPETPEGMTAYNIDGFVYFIWNDWIEDKEDDIQTKYRRNDSGDDNEGLCIIQYEDLSDREDGLTPSDAIGGFVLGLFMSAPEGSAEVIPEYTTFRGIEGVLLTIGGKNLIWLAQHKNAVVMVAFTDQTVSMTEMRSMLLQVLGGSEDDIERVDME